LLGAATTATAYVNLRATQIQEQSDNNFYSADTIMNAIVSGLENDISRAYESAYTKVVTNLDNEEVNANQEKFFKQYFLEYLGVELNGELDKDFYSVSKIQGYVQDTFSNNISYTISALNGQNFLDVFDGGLILRNLHVTYENDNGYFDEISTDIKIVPPAFNSTIPITPPKTNGLVIDDGLEINDDKGLIINGNAYINEREADSIYKKNESESNNVILLHNSSCLEIYSPEEIIAGGLIKTEDNADITMQGSGDNKNAVTIWTEDFDLGRYTTAKIFGDMHVYDDFEVNGSHARVTLSGNYYGYNRSGNDASESSAININGADTIFDIQQLDALVLAGSSYVSTSSVESGKDDFVNSDDILLGEAISVKSNQIAYFVDDSEFKIKTESPWVISNPMNYDQYKAMLDHYSGTDEEKKAAAMQAIADYPLSYGKSYSDFGASIMPVFSAKDNGTVYLYLKFTDPDKASEYFVTAYHGDSLLSQRLRTYAAEYITSLHLNPDSDLLVNQNYILQSLGLYSSTNLPTLDKDGFGYGQHTPNHTNPEQQETLDNLIIDLKKQYLDDGTIDGNGKKYEIMYHKLINQKNLEDFIAGATKAASAAYNPEHHTNNSIEIITDASGETVGVSLTGTNDAKALIIDNLGKDRYVLGEGSGLAIISGDVEITGNWLGTIIVGGRAYVTQGSKEAKIVFTVDETVVASVVDLYFTIDESGKETSMMVANIFNAMKDSVVNTATDDEGIDNDMVSQCITFTNWKRD
jgi:hypothetical protein